MATGIFRRPFRPPASSQSPFGAFSAIVGPVSAVLTATEQDDTLSADAALEVAGVFATAEAGDVPSLASAVQVAASASLPEGDDTVSATATLELAGSVAAGEADDVPSAAGTVALAGSSGSVEQDDTVSANAALGIAAHVAVAEEDDRLSASSLMPVWYPRRGGVDEREEHELRLREWQESLRRIIDRSWRIAEGEIDPVTFEPIPPPDYSVIVAGLLGQALSLDRERRAAFVAERERHQADEAVAILLLAA